MSSQFAPEDALSVGIDPHRDTLEGVAIRFPEVMLMDEEFEKTLAGQRALLQQARELASAHSLRLSFGVEDSANYGYNLARYLGEQGCEVKEVNPVETDRQRDFYGKDKTDHLDALATAAVVLRAYDSLPDVKPIREASLEKAQLILDNCEQVLSSNQGLLIETQAQIILDLARRLVELHESIEDVKAHLEVTVSATGQQLETTNGAGIVLAGRLIADTVSTECFDNDPNRYASYNGTAPAIKGSGQHYRHVENKRCNRRLKNAFHQLAVNAIRCEPLSKACYERLVEEKGMESRHAVKRLMRRLSDIVFAMMRDKTPYDPNIHRRKQQQGGTKKEESVAAARQRQE